MLVDACTPFHDFISRPVSICLSLYDRSFKISVPWTQLFSYKRDWIHGYTLIEPRVYWVLVRHQWNKDPYFRSCHCICIENSFERLIHFDFHFQPTKVEWFISHTVVGIKCAFFTLPKCRARMLTDFHTHTKKKHVKMKCNEQKRRASEKEERTLFTLFWRAPPVNSTLTTIVCPVSE